VLRRSPLAPNFLTSTGRDPGFSDPGNLEVVGGWTRWLSSWYSTPWRLRHGGLRGVSNPEFGNLELVSCLMQRQPFWYSRTSISGRGENTRHAPVCCIIPLNDARSTCETRQNAQKPTAYSFLPLKAVSLIEVRLNTNP
jgi:hypothetical protein